MLRYDSGENVILDILLGSVLKFILTDDKYDGVLK